MSEKFNPEKIQKNVELESEIQLEPEKIAQKKLEILMQKDFKDFGIRFMNIGEYDKIIKKGDYEEREVFIPKIFHGNKMNFKSFFQSRGHSWGNFVRSSTDWDTSVRDLHHYADLIDFLREAHGKIKKNGEEENIREKTMERFRNKIEKNERRELSTHKDKIFGEGKGAEWYIKNLPTLIGDKQALEFMNLVDGVVEAEHQETFNPNYNSNRNEDKSYYLKVIQKMIDEIMGSDENKGYDVYRAFNLIYDQKKQIKWIGEERFKILMDFKKDSNYLKKGDNLRKFINAYSYVRTGIAYDKESLQYHVGLLFDMKAISNRDSWGHPEWRYLQTDKSEGAKSNVLGVIALMPNKELINKLVQSSNKSGLLAHPVFDGYGNIKYPKKSKDKIKENL
ncbi:hypothetical protein K8R66_00085 [bacterium]|nr:hypothetical protein [bacterium]